MDSIIKLASGDNNNAATLSPRLEEVRSTEEEEGNGEQKPVPHDAVTPQVIDENEMMLKERIAQCRNIIESLKFELNEEKVKLEKATKAPPRQLVPEILTRYTSGYRELSLSNNEGEDFTRDTDMVSATVDSKLSCDKNLMEYEKQLEKYQNTLNMAQVEKKNAIRKQMLAKAYRLKLLEVENQCNIELLRVKQNLQCLEPLKIIASKWNSTSKDETTYDFNNFELLPSFPELNSKSGCEVNTTKEDICTKIQSDKSESSE